jgi:hypothetical protein
MNRPQWVCRNIPSAADEKFVTMYAAHLSTLKGLQVLIEICLLLNHCIQISVIHEDGVNICHICLHFQNVIYPKVTCFIYYYVYSCSICSPNFFFFLMQS